VKGRFTHFETEESTDHHHNLFLFVLPLLIIHEESKMTKYLQDKIDLLPKHAKGLAVVHLIKECLEHPNIFVYGELMDLPNVQGLADNPETEPWVRLLQVFAFGTYQDYRLNKSTLPELTPLMEHKLRSLSIITIGEKNKRIAYTTLLKELEMESLREVEDLLIDVIYTKAIEGKMDQKNSWIEVESTIARDIKKDQLDSIATILTAWCENCDDVLSNIEQEIVVANSLKVDNVQKRQELEATIAKIRANVKTAGPNLSQGVGLEYEIEEFEGAPTSHMRGSPQMHDNMFGRLKSSFGGKMNPRRKTPSKIRQVHND
jgi:COP9 signalosome complex subunit 7